MAVSEPFEATDANGVTVRGTVDVGHEREGDFFNPASPNYKQPRFANYRFAYFNTREACTIDPETLEDAMRNALRKALIRFGIDGPKEDRISADVHDSVEATRQQCTRNVDKFVSNETTSAVDLETGQPVGHVTARAYAAVQTPDGGVRKVLAGENTWPIGDVTPFNGSGRDADAAAAGSAGEAAQTNALPSDGRLPILPTRFEGQGGQQFVSSNPRAAGSAFALPRSDMANSGVPATGLLNLPLGQIEAATVSRVPSTDEVVKLASAEAENSGRPVRYLSRRMAGRMDAPTGGLDVSPFDVDSAAAPLVPSDDIIESALGGEVPRGLEPSPPRTLPGLVSGKPMDYSLPPLFFGVPQALAADDEDWLLQLLAPRGGR